MLNCQSEASRHKLLLVRRSDLPPSQSSRVGSSEALTLKTTKTSKKTIMIFLFFLQWRITLLRKFGENYRCVSWKRRRCSFKKTEWRIFSYCLHPISVTTLPRQLQSLDFISSSSVSDHCKCLLSGAASIFSFTVTNTVFNCLAEESSEVCFGFIQGFSFQILFFFFLLLWVKKCSHCRCPLTAS